MADKKIFYIDGKAYNVHVLSLVRKFAVLDTDKAGRTLNGKMYREPIGTFYNYSMTVSVKNGDTKAMEDLWKVISQPEVSHKCKFLYGNDYLEQDMYITSGEQTVVRLLGDKTYWGDMSLSFIAMKPKVTA